MLYRIVVQRMIFNVQCLIAGNLNIDRIFELSDDDPAGCFVEYRWGSEAEQFDGRNVQAQR